MIKIPNASPERAKAFFQDKIDFTCGPVEAQHMLTDAKDEIQLIDVRAADDFAKEHIPGAINLTKDNWASLHGLDRNKLNLVYCYSGVCHLAASACAQFAEQGYRVMEIDGGMKEWKIHKMDVEKGTMAPMPDRTSTRRAG